jgi:transglutaminase-like putative cysteine protease
MISRNALAWLLVAQLLLILPHSLRMPLWIVATFVICAGWRMMVYQGRWSLPGKWLKWGLAIMAGAGILVSYGNPLGVEPTVALLIAGFSLKLLEVSQQRDVYLLLFLGYFVAITQFLFSQDLLVVLYMLLPVWALTAALVAVHQRQFVSFHLHSGKKAGLIFLQALPLMLVLYLIFPRFEALWQVPLPSHQAQTGMSDSFSPGDISELSLSDKLAFRVSFDGDLPAAKQLYWRGMVMSHFDGRRWSAVEQTMSPEPIEPEGESWRYRVILEPSHQPWLFSLTPAISSTNGVLTGYGHSLRFKTQVYERIQYTVNSYPRSRRSPVINLQERQRELQLPRRGNEQARVLAKQLYGQAKNEQEYVRRVLQLFRQQNFYYTLKPPRLGVDSIDDFLFTHRRGFCGHYASSFVFLMRAAGLPARVVGGYQGGEVNPISRTVLVHQFDAHAWAEVWLPGLGWQSFDPTAMVAPERIENGIEQALAEEFLADTPLSPLKYRHWDWLNTLRLRWDALGYYWHSWVLQYRGQQQLELLEHILGQLTATRLVIFMTSSFAVVLALVALSSLRRQGRKTSSPAVVSYKKLCDKLAKKGVPRAEGEGPIDYARRVSSQCPEYSLAIQNATRAFVMLSYQPLTAAQQQSLLKLLKRELRAF